MFNNSTPLPSHRVCPNSGTLIFDPDPALDLEKKIKKMSAVMLNLSECLARGEAPSDDVVAVLKELNR